MQCSRTPCDASSRFGATPPTVATRRMRRKDYATQPQKPQNLRFIPGLASLVSDMSPEHQSQIAADIASMESLNAARLAKRLFPAYGGGGAA